MFVLRKANESCEHRTRGRGGAHGPLCVCGCDNCRCSAFYHAVHRCRMHCAAFLVQHTHVHSGSTAPRENVVFETSVPRLCRFVSLSLTLLWCVVWTDRQTCKSMTRVTRLTGTELVPELELELELPLVRLVPAKWRRSESCLNAASTLCRPMCVWVCRLGNLPPSRPLLLPRRPCLSLPITPLSFCSLSLSLCTRVWFVRSHRCVEVLQQ